MIKAEQKLGLPKTPYIESTNRCNLRCPLCPTGSGKYLTLNEVAGDLTQRLCRLFLHDEAGMRAIHGDQALLQRDPHFRDHLLFHEYFDGDTGRGLGASHQTGWTGLIAKLLYPRRPPSASP